MFRRQAYQYYTNVNYLTCAECLSWHGMIRRRREAFPQREDGCACSILPIPKKQMAYFRERSREMRLRAQGELARRALFEQAMTLLPNQPDETLELLKRAATIDLYIPDIERFVERAIPRSADEARLPKPKILWSRQVFVLGRPWFAAFLYL